MKFYGFFMLALFGGLALALFAILLVTAPLPWEVR